MPLLIAALALVGGWLAVSFVGAALRRHQVRRVLSGRDPAVSLATCMEAFSGIERERVELAYLWVQQLVDVERAPICADDDVSRDLQIDQGETDDKFESSHEWRGIELDESASAPQDPIRTVRDLMGEVLAYGYEGYSRIDNGVPHLTSEMPPPRRGHRK